MPINFIFALNLPIACTAWSARVVLSLYALDLGAEPYAIGMLAATFPALAILFSVPGGRLADRYGARWLLMVMAGAGVLGLLLPYFFHGLPAVFAAAAMIGLSAGIFDVLLQNLVGLLSTAETRARNFSNWSLVGSTANLAGPLVAGVTIDHLGYANTCLGLALLMVLPLIMLGLSSNAMRGSAHRERAKGGGMRAILLAPGAPRALATSSLLNAGRDLYRFYIPVYAHALNLSASVIGTVLALNAAAEFAVRLALPYLLRRYKEEQLLAYAFFIGAFMLVLIPFLANAILLALASAIFGLGMGCGAPIVAMLMFSNAPAGRSGEALGLKVTVNQITRLVGPIVFGVVGSAFGLAYMFWSNALMLGAGGMLSRSARTQARRS